ncbi:MAG: 23S rRNA (guanosine(2251)-2'-O)-methyltransferase RlmB [Clostridiales bacterium]|jgi:23S rRNA (guanosine2251-2'-O)-methyltransferase|nr:23S rRNA (guanosine(2251)-2'-O)-methyltransferase RlmB [Clostridiales bacterium]
MDTSEYQVEGRNAVLHALQSGRNVDKLYIAQGDRSFGNLIALAKAAGAVISQIPRQRLNQMATTPKHQGVIAVCSPMGYVEVGDILARARGRGEDPFVIALDSLEDPHNLGAILRTANAAGVHGVIITKHRSVGLNSTVAKTSAGAVEHTPVARVTNLSQTVDQLKNAGLWVYGAATNVAETYTQTEMKGPICLVIGNEGVGISKRIVQICDFLVSIPMRGEIESLNASVAAALLMYEVVRQRKVFP